MIVRKNQDSFILITQHDHAQISGQIVDNWKPDYFSHNESKKSVITAIYQHDCSWINLDAAPFWNDHDQIPYSFTDYPTAPKVVHYQAGINELQEIDLYAALLSSLHYTSFPDLGATKFGQAFLTVEFKRHATLKDTLGLHTPAAENLLNFHLQLLKFCDNLSLYICLNEPGVKKEAEYPWFRNGIPHSEQFAFTQGEKINPSWLNATHIQVKPFPFAAEFTVTVPYKKVSSAAIARNGLATAFEQAPLAAYEVSILG